MRAAVVEAFGEPLLLREWDTPTPGANQILVKTEACGVCNTDLHASRGDWPTKLGDWIVISGIGGLGHLAIQYAKAMGLHVCAVDIDDGKLAYGMLMGADVTINARLPHAVEQVKKTTSGSAHGVLITAPPLADFTQGVAITRKRETCVLTGLPPGKFPFPLFDVVLNCITVRGSLVGTRQDMAEALAFAVEGKVKADIELQALSAINEVLARLMCGKVAARVVIDLASH